MIVGGYRGRVPLVAASVCPHPPMLVPEVASGAAPELDDLRAACALAVRHLLDANPRSLLVIGSGSSLTTWHGPVTASFAPFGVPLEITLERATAVASRPLPVSLLVATWLLREVDTSVEISLRSVPETLPPALCARWRPETSGPGRQPFNDEQPWALLVVGDGSACRTNKAPGYFDPRAEAFDETVAQALAAADMDTLLRLDPALAAELWCAGRAPWQVLAGLVEADGRPWTGEVHYNEFPQGVTYLVATLAPAGGPMPNIGS